MKILSLGWGIQSWTIAAMVALGELPEIDAAVHADTTHERSQTYEFARLWSGWLRDRGVKVYTVQADSFEFGEKGRIGIPAYTISKKGNGQIRRQCTGDWKIAPIRRWLQKNREGAPVELWLGISLDEYKRMRDSDVKYITHRWPLIEKKMTRKDCETWLAAHNLPIPVKSSCVFCPYHNMAAWREMKNSNNGDWERAVAIDEKIRSVRPPYDLFVHPARIPLQDIDLRTKEEVLIENGQIELWANWDIGLQSCKAAGLAFIKLACQLLYYHIDTVI